MGGALRTSMVYAGTTPLLAGADYGAYCPNSCSRHGVCRNFGKCSCYTRQGTEDAAWTQHDCSVRTCPKHTSWVDSPDANDDAHKRGWHMRRPRHMCRPGMPAWRRVVCATLGHVG